MTNKRVCYFLILFAIGMLLLSYAFVPLYNLFCKTTGYLGYVDKGIYRSSYVVSDKVMRVRFNTDIASDLPWKFYSELPFMDVKVGDNNLAFFYAENTSNENSHGVAVYNVTPYRAARYFKKVACFCFEKQTLMAHSKAVMPVAFYIDPAIEKDSEASYLDTITLSYTFFKF